MKLKLIKVKDYLLLIDEEAEIKEGNYRVHIYEKTLNHPVHRLEHGENTFDTWKLVLAYYPLSKEAKELDLPLLPSFEEINVEELAEQHLQKWRGLNNVHLSNRIQADRCKNDFVAGYKAAQSNKQFSLDDIKKAFIAGLEFIPVDPNRYEEDADNYIQSLTTQQTYPKEFIPEYEYYYHSSKEFYKDAKFEKCSKEQYKSIKEEIPTCPVKVELKTSTSSEGREELVGTWKF